MRFDDAVSTVQRYHFKSSKNKQEFTQIITLRKQIIFTRLVSQFVYSFSGPFLHRCQSQSNGCKTECQHLTNNLLKQVAYRSISAGPNWFHVWVVAEKHIDDAWCRIVKMGKLPTIHAIAPRVISPISSKRRKNRQGLTRHRSRGERIYIVSYSTVAWNITCSQKFTPMKCINAILHDMKIDDSKLAGWSRSRLYKFQLSLSID